MTTIAYKNAVFFYPSEQHNGLILAKKLAHLAKAEGVAVTPMSDVNALFSSVQDFDAVLALESVTQTLSGHAQAQKLAGKLFSVSEYELLGAVDVPALFGRPAVASLGSSQSSTSQPLRFVAITACPTGVAHTFMSADALQAYADEAGHVMKVETQGSVGAKNILTEEEIAAADFVILATDIEVNADRFVGKKVYRTSTGAALKQTKKVFEEAIATATVHGNAQSQKAAESTKSTKSGSAGSSIYKHLMTGVSFMLPIVVAGGLLIAMSFVFGIEAFKNEGSLADVLMQTGKAAFTLMIPILSGYIAYSIADRAGLAAGLVGGLLSAQLGAGFLGAIVSGFLAGYVALFLAKKLRLPQTMEALKPILIIPLLSSLAIGLLMFYVVGAPVAYLLSSMESFLTNLGTGNLILLGAVLGGMMCVDMGGPINKAAYTFSVGLLTLDTPNQFPIAAAMAGGMVPAIGMGVATLLAKSKFTADEQSAGKASFVLGLCFISEGAIPFAAKDPSRVLPACILGGAVTGGLVGLFNMTLAAPHGGIFVLLIPNAINKPLLYLLAIAVGSVLTGVLYAVLKPKEKLALASA